ncbi:uncharacterized protein LOC115474855 [Microcaecilia unicolor]|uniref:Uncharacterized protein LOC115474855 n=1 Tax=Microcaecilia unicolor TaxID=1415580 RepID=A0A6P7YT21_9AMPH|nr:uncharacterized protein LOC115474855 [Microcaecilia unicolor]
MGNTQKKEYDTTENPAIKHADWMSFLPDGKSLRDLSIPGTNNSLQFSGGDAFQCQSWSLKKQYEAGIRFVNIPLKHSNHKVVVLSENRHLFFDAVFKDTIDFLRQHSKEIILIHAYEAHSKTRELHGAMVRCIVDAGISWFWVATYIPTLGQARGKIIMLQDFLHPMNGIFYKNLKVAENKHIPTVFDIGKKWASIERNLTEAQKREGDKMYLTFSAGSSLGAYPYTVAREMNYNLYKFLDHRKKEKNRWGIIAMDFPGSFLVQLIINNN